MTHQAGGSTENKFCKIFVSCFAKREARTCCWLPLPEMHRLRSARDPRQRRDAKLGLPDYCPHGFLELSQAWSRVARKPKRLFVLGFVLAS